MLKKANTADFYRSLDMTKMYSIFFFFLRLPFRISRDSYSSHRMPLQIVKHFLQINQFTHGFTKL